MNDPAIRNEIRELLNRIIEDASYLSDPESSKSEMRRKLLSINISVHELHELIAKLP